VAIAIARAAPVSIVVSPSGSAADDGTRTPTPEGELLFMADPATETGATPDRRDRRRARSRRRVRHVVALIGALAVLAVAALVATDAVRFGDDRPSLAGTVSVAGPDGSPAPTTTTGARNCRPLSTTEPLRLWVGGDSLAGSLGPALGKLAGATGVVQPYFDSRVSSGLANPGFFDWPEHGAKEMTRLDPEVVVFLMGTNDFSAVGGDWKDDYADAVESMMQTLIGSGRTVYWLGAPTLRSDDMDEAVVEVNALVQDVAERHAQVHYVDTHAIFADTDGTFAFDLPDETGTTVTMRAGDGVHLTTEGADHLARQVYTLVDAQCAVTEQQVEGAALATIQTEGSTQVAPSGRSGTSNQSGGTIATTPPATAPTTTSPPVTTTLPASTTTVPASTTTTVAGGPSTG
jgi:hypothetical protein